MNKKTVLIIICATICAVILGILIWYNSGKKAVNSTKNAEIVRVEIEEGKGIIAIADLLENKNVIKSSSVMKIYAKLHKGLIIQAGTYDLDNSQSLDKIISVLKKGQIADETINITFIEGKNMRKIAQIIANNTNNSEEAVFQLLKDEEYIDSLIDKYWFLTDRIKNKDIYYSLEGYLLPDTYNFESRDVSVEKIFSVMLDSMKKFLDENKFESELDVHDVLTLASMAELEGVQNEDRREIAGVFINRLNKGMNLGSDVTTYYAMKVDMGERDLYANELNRENPYNTRGPNMAGKLPVGPICNPSKDAILATINYKETDNLYFVADKNRKIYFSKNNSEHLDMIKELKNNGLWYEY